MKNLLEVIKEMSVLETDSTFNINISNDNSLSLEIDKNGYIVYNQNILVQKVGNFGIMKPSLQEDTKIKILRFFFMLIGHEENNKYKNHSTQQVYGFWVSNGSIFFSEDFDFSAVGLRKDGFGFITPNINGENFVLVKQGDKGYKIRVYERFLQVGENDLTLYDLENDRIVDYGFKTMITYRNKFRHYIHIGEIHDHLVFYQNGYEVGKFYHNQSRNVSYITRDCHLNGYLYDGNVWGFVINLHYKDSTEEVLFVYGKYTKDGTLYGDFKTVLFDPKDRVLKEPEMEVGFNFETKKFLSETQNEFVYRVFGRLEGFVMEGLNYAYDFQTKEFYVLDEKFGVNPSERTKTEDTILKTELFNNEIIPLLKGMKRKLEDCVFTQNFDEYGHTDMSISIPTKSQNIFVSLNFSF